MEEAVHRFVRLLRLSGLRIGVSEAVDAMTALAVPGIAADRELTRSALRVSLVKDRRDEAAFDWVFDRFFGLRTVPGGEPEHGSHEHDDLSDTGTLEQFSLSEEPGRTPEQGHSHGKPADIRRYFDPEDLAARYNLHQEANRIDLASLTDKIVLSDQAGSDASGAARVQLTASRLHNPGRPGELAPHPGLRVDAELSVAQEMALLSWLADAGAGARDGDDGEAAALEQAELAALRGRLAGLLDRLPEALRRGGCCAACMARPGRGARSRPAAPSTAPAPCAPTSASTGCRSGR